jgi:hypothetical protein
VFCDSKESIHHLFISCPFARLVWRVVEFTFSLPPPTNITNLFGNWLSVIVKEDRARIRVGVCALLWTLWNCRNDLVFNKTGHANFLQVIHKTTYWIHTWSFLLPEGQRESMDSGCGRLETVARTIYSQAGWRHASRIDIT